MFKLKKDLIDYRHDTKRKAALRATAWFEGDKKTDYENRIKAQDTLYNIILHNAAEANYSYDN